MCCIDIIFFIFIFQLMDLAEGRIVLVLEGGYNLDSIAKSMHACLEVLLEDKPLVGSSEAHPLESTWRVIQAVITCGPLLWGNFLIFPWGVWD
jgi:histone deacetylase 6